LRTTDGVVDLGERGLRDGAGEPRVHGSEAEGEAAYVASKAAVEALTKVVAKELAPQGVRVAAFGLGPVDTRLTRAVPKAALAKINDAIGRPQGTTMAQAVDFIVSRISAPDLKSGSVEYFGTVG
ncbi:MAG: SDR family oxidoreductase, partial [Verrucomicrobia bacterium]|nr:SDR family oxidoreductase [Verrucomicrobiota bacterium]